MGRGRSGQHCVASCLYGCEKSGYACGVVAVVCVAIIVLCWRDQARCVPAFLNRCAAWRAAARQAGGGPAGLALVDNSFFTLLATAASRCRPSRHVPRLEHTARTGRVVQVVLLGALINSHANVANYDVGRFNFEEQVEYKHYR